jgi:hypothetical protein
VLWLSRGWLLSVAGKVRQAIYRFVASTAIQFIPDLRADLDSVRARYVKLTTTVCS